MNRRPLTFPLDPRLSTKTYTLFFSKHCQKVNNTILHKLLQLLERHVIKIINLINKRNEWTGRGILVSDFRLGNALKAFREEILFTQGNLYLYISE